MDLASRKFSIKMLFQRKNILTVKSHNTHICDLCESEMCETHSVEGRSAVELDVATVGLKQGDCFPIGSCHGRKVRTMDIILGVIERCMAAPILHIWIYAVFQEDFQNF